MMRPNHVSSLVRAKRLAELPQGDPQLASSRFLPSLRDPDLFNSDSNRRDSWPTSFRRAVIRRGCLAFTSCIVIMLGLGCTSEKNSVALEAAKLRGTWQLVYQEMNGQKLPDEKTAEMFHGKMVFAGDKNPLHR